MKNGKKILFVAIVVTFFMVLMVKSPDLVYAYGETNGKCGENMTWNFDEVSKTLIY